MRSLSRGTKNNNALLFLANIGILKTRTNSIVLVLSMKWRRLVMKEEAVPRVPRQARSRAKYQAILQAGLELFREQSYAETTVDAIVERSGVSVGVFYSYFASKRQLLLALLADELNLEAADVFDPSSHTLTLAECESVLRRLLRQRSDLVRVRQELVLVDPEFAEQDREIRQCFHEQLAATLERLRREGRIRADITSSTCAWMLRAIFARLIEITASLPSAQVEDEIHAAALPIYHMLVADEIDTSSSRSAGEASSPQES
jgi:AcrR family transcriptional regulator